MILDFRRITTLKHYQYTTKTPSSIIDHFPNKSPCQAHHLTARAPSTRLFPPLHPVPIINSYSPQPQQPRRSHPTTSALPSTNPHPIAPILINHHHPIPKMTETTPRISARYLQSFTGQTVRMLGKVVSLRGETATVDVGGSVVVLLNRVSWRVVCATGGAREEEA